MPPGPVGLGGIVVSGNERTYPGVVEDAKQDAEEEEKVNGLIPGGSCRVMPTDASPGVRARSTEGSLMIEAKILPATASRPTRVKAKVVGGTAELILPRSTRSKTADLESAATKLAEILNRRDLSVVAPTKDGYLYRAVM